MPVVFMKPDSSIMRNRRPFFLPDSLGRIECRVGLLVRISRLGKSIAARFAGRYIDAVTLGIDFTATDLQREMAAKGLPQDMSTCFDQSLAVGEWIGIEKVQDIQNLDFSLKADDVTVQKANTAQMLSSVAKTIEFVSRYCTLKTGDMIFTGTPAGAPAAQIGQHLQGYIENENVLDFHVR